MFSYTTKDGLLTIEEAFNGWYITHNSTDTTRGMGDSYFVNEDDDGNLVQTSQADVEHSIEIDKNKLLEAYFPDILNDDPSRLFCPVCGREITYFPVGRLPECTNYDGHPGGGSRAILWFNDDD